jgi:hypothetical protein
MEETVFRNVGTQNLDARGITQKKEHKEKKAFPIILVALSAQPTAILTLILLM